MKQTTKNNFSSILLIVIVYFLFFNTYKAQSYPNDIPEDIIIKDVQAQNDQDINSLISIRIERLRNEYLQMSKNEDFFIYRINEAKLIGEKEIPLEVAKNIISPNYFYEYEKLYVFYAAINYNLKYEDKYLYNGINYRLYVIADIHNEYQIVENSSAPVPYLLNNGYSFGTTDEKLRLNKLSSSLSNPTPPQIIRVKMIKTGAIVPVDFQEYVRDVVPREWWITGDVWSSETYKAGAICAKMYGWWKTIYPQDYYFDLYDDAHSQCYLKGDHLNHPKIDQAVLDVQNVGMYGDQQMLFIPEYWNGLATEFNSQSKGITIYSAMGTDKTIIKKLQPGVRVECLSRGIKHTDGKYWWLVRVEDDHSIKGYAKGEDMMMFPKGIELPISGNSGDLYLTERVTQYGTGYLGESGMSFKDMLSYFYKGTSRLRGQNDIQLFNYTILKTKIGEVSLSSNSAFPNSVLSIFYKISSNNSANVLLAASFSPSGMNNWIYSDSDNDKRVDVINGTSNFSRQFQVPNNIYSGNYDLLVALWSDENNNGKIDTQIDKLLDSQIKVNVLQIIEQQPSVQITINSIPSGLSFNVDNTSNYQTPFTFTWTKNSTHSITWNSIQDGQDGTRYAINKWNDNLSTNPRAIIASSNTSYTMNFNTQYYLTMLSNGNGIVSPGSGWFNKGESVIIKATSNSGSVFTSWNGNGSGSYNGELTTTSILMNNQITQTANFTSSVGTIAVTTPTQNSTLTIGGQGTVSWSASSNIFTFNVKLSIDGGKSYPIVLASSVSNSNHTFVVPNYVSDLCIIKVESAKDENVFGISSSFSIKPEIIFYPPTAITDPPSSVTGNSVQLNASINPNGLSTSYYFEYGTTNNFGNKTITKTLSNSSSNEIVNEIINSLSPNTIYYFRVVAQNSAGTTKGNQISFNTLQAETNKKPLVFTRNATNYNYNSATLNASINANGKSTNYYFVYGKTTAYGSQTNQKNIGSVSDYIEVNEKILGLETVSTYHFKVIASNVDGVTEGNDFTFTTENINTNQLPVVQTTSSGNITTTFAQVKGTVNPNGYNTTYYFEYGINTSYGSKSTEQMSGIGTSNIDVAADLSGLNPETIYHFRLVGINAAGTSLGQDMMFKTASTTAVPILIYEAPSGIYDKSAQMNAKVNPNGFPTTAKFEWGETTSYGNSTNPYAIGYGTSEVHYQGYLNGILNPGTTYHYRAIATNSIGTTYSPDYTFKTLSGPLKPPTVTTISATNITENSVQFNGTVNPNEVSCNYSFLYGYSPAGNGKQATWIDIPAGVEPVSVSQYITGLTPNTAYTFQIYAQSRGGSSWGNKIDFKTLTANVPPPDVITLNASQIKVTEAYINAAINPNGSPTTYYFEYGLTQSYGQTTQTEMTSNQTTPVNVSAVLQSLTPSTIYHYRIIASNAGGSVVGQDKTFSTFLTLVNPPSVSTLPQTDVSSSTARLKGKINPNNQLSSYYFEYGVSINFGNKTNTRAIDANNSFQDVSDEITNLLPNTSYYYRLIAENAGGKTEGEILNFKTSDEQFKIILSVNSSEAGIVNGSGTFGKGQNININAIPNNGYSFNNWTENDSIISLNSSYDFKIEKDRNFVANFKIIPNPKISVQPSSSVIVGSSSGRAKVVITNIGTGDITWSATCQDEWITIPKANGKDRDTLVINYNENNGPERSSEISVSADGFKDSYVKVLIKQDSLITYNVYTTSNPGNAGVTTGMGHYKLNSKVNVTAISNEDYEFKNWEENGNVLTTTANYEFTVNRNISLIANFEYLPKSSFIVNLSASPQEGGTISGAGNFNKGVNVNINATPNDGWHFIAWIEGKNLISTNQSYSFEIDNNRDLVALFQFLTDVNQKEIVTDYLLYQNYPNPFNPTTKINFEIPNACVVILKVYDILGREIKTLANNYMNAGRYEIEFNAKDLSSGIYFYKLQTDQYTKVKKMLFLR